MRENISVCMATYNGSPYIEQQISSIIKELILGDELIIIDDCSTDNTVEIIKTMENDFIKIYNNTKNVGYVKTFEKALSFASNNYICLSDQDDIWNEGRVGKLYKAIKEEKVLLVVSNFEIYNQSKNEIKFQRLSEISDDFFENIIRIFGGKSAYYGCTMMMHKNILKYILPFPSYIEAHDLWIAMSANALKSIHHLKDNTLSYRVHQNNTSLKKRKLYVKFRARYFFLKTLIAIFKRINK